jgi:hypothetical protein
MYGATLFQRTELLEAKVAPAQLEFKAPADYSNVD